MTDQPSAHSPSAVLSMIVAMAHDRVIGKDNEMPWHLPADLQWFKRSTLGKPVIMGRKTYDSIGRALPGRDNIIITRDIASVDSSPVNVHVCDTIDKAIDLSARLCQMSQPATDEVFIIGGATLYEQLLPQAQRLYITHIDAKLDGDTQFPDYDAKSKHWQQVHHEQHQPDDANPHPYAFEVLERV